MSNDGVGRGREVCGEPPPSGAARAAGRGRHGRRARSPAWWRAVIWVLGSCAGACSAPRQSVPQRPSLLEPEQPLAEASSAPQWRYHPRKPAHLLRAYQLEGGQTLLVGALGERWLSDSRGAARASAVLAPETLIGALRTTEGWTFVGLSGSTYAAESPLGAFSRATFPPKPLGLVATGRTTLLGIGEDGRLLLSEDGGSSWRSVGPAGVRFTSSWLAPPQGLALAIPEQIWWSADEGRTWQALDSSPLGATRFAQDEESGATLETALGARSVRLDRSPPELVALGRKLRPEEVVLPSPPVAGPNARALAAGRAFVSNGHYFEVELGVSAESLSGPFAGPLVRRPLPALGACQEIEVAGFASWVYAACTRERVGAARRYEFYRSSDGGESFEREGFEARGNPDVVRLAVGAEGELLVTGFCSAKEDLTGCRPQGIQARRARAATDAGANFDLELVPAPALDDAALALAFSSDGRTAYAVGGRTKNDALFLFVSTDRARGFVAREIDELEHTGLPVTRLVKGLTPTRAGELSLVIGQATGPDQLVVLDAGGHTLSVNAAPMDLATIGAYGSRALAIGPDEAWESASGGAQWESLGPLPRPICGGSRARCSAPIACNALGCSAGDGLSRVGWNGRASSMLPTPPAAAHPAGESPRALGSAFACELVDAEWSPLAGVEHLPDVAQAALGKAEWFALSEDEASAAAGIWIADTAGTRAEDAARVRHSELFGPSERAAELAHYATLQVEGAAALRYALPGDATPGRQSLRVEVAWENLFEGRRGRGTILDAGSLLPGDFVKTSSVARRARPDLLSISSGGIYVRVHHQSEQRQPSYFLDGNGVRELSVAVPEGLPPESANAEMVRLGQDHLALSFLNQGATVVRGKPRGQHWQFDAMTIGFVDAERFSLRQQRDITYLQGRAALHSSVHYTDGTSEAFVFPLLAEGPVFGTALAVPTQADVLDRSLGCSAREREVSPRILAPHDPGTRRAVLVRDRVEPLRVLLTDGAVLHGTPSAPCVAAYDAEPVRTAAGSAATRERALLGSDGASWLFRVAPEGTRRDARIEYRAMRCTADPAAEAPPELFDLPDTHAAN
jgi:hypothetical protein